MGSPAGIEQLLREAAGGDEHAWRTIVERFTGLVWATARAHRLATADAADVVQTTWLRLVEHLDRIREPERLGAWLATTARHECLRTIRLQGRELPSEDAEAFEGADAAGSPDANLLTRERDSALWNAFTKIADRCQRLLRLLAASDPPTYEEISAATGMPIGAIGPTRARCLDQLRRALDVSVLEAGPS